ncbi:hypothetical protein TRFO_26245 [Tritrichomonas foetus]|uniref:Importin N-terminal domain-containing protein n=1 Tax=Tritrichomonas foetus TaxID=1144522 RepID=A0A1J4K898_9EUKA|nr:hypothetical protein TRFO_26245 [Tritrichomonas foetus]|eukprot:OHT05886.1 hypothetical protein TRFO_26245 [Tritrichomonas foetus]
MSNFDANQISQVLITFYTELQNPSLQNANEVTDSLLKLYSLPQSINILINILLTSDNIFFKQQAAFGLKHSLSACESLIDQNDFHNIWNGLFQILNIENEENMIDIILLPVIQLFNICQKQWNYISNFITGLSNNNFPKFLHILSNLIFFLEPSFVIEKLDYFMDIIDNSLIFIKNNQCFLLFKYSFLIYHSLSVDVIKDNQELYEILKNKFRENFSLILIEILHDETIMKSLISYFISAFDHCINPFSLSLLMQPIFNILNDSLFSIEMKYNTILLFTGLLEHDEFIIDNDILKHCIQCSIPLSFEIFNHSLNIEDPDSSIFNEFFYRCLNRIPIKLIPGIVLPFIQQLSLDLIYSKMYTLLILTDACLRRSETNIILKENQQIFEFFQFLIACLQSNHLGIRNEASYFFCAHFSIFAFFFAPLFTPIASSSDILQKIFDFINFILKLIVNNSFEIGFNILLTFINNISTIYPDWNNFEETIYPNKLAKEFPIYSVLMNIFTFCIHQINFSDISTVIMNWEIIGVIVEKSKFIANSVFEKLYMICFSVIQNLKSQDDLKSNSDIPLLPYLLKCISSLVQNCNEQIKNNLPEIVSVILNCMITIDDFETKKSTSKCLESFIINTSEEMTPFIPDLISYILGICQLSPYQFLQKHNNNLFKLRQHIKYVIFPLINLLNEIIRHYPELFLESTILSTILNITKILINGLFNKEIIAGCKLLKEIVNLLNNHDLLMPQVLGVFSINLIEKLRNEIHLKVILSIIDVINEIVMIYGNEILCGKESFLLDCILNFIYQNRNPFTNEFIFQQSFLDTSFELLNNIINNFDENLEANANSINNSSNPHLIDFVHPFLEKMLNLLKENNHELFSYSLRIITSIIIKSTDIIPIEVLLMLIQTIFPVIENELSTISLHSIIFLISLGYNYSQLLSEFAPQIISLIDKKISTLNQSNSDQRCLIEHLLALYAMLDNCTQCLMNDESRIKWILSFLPIIYSKSYTNRFIYMLLIKYCNKFPNIQQNIWQILLNTFISSQTITNSELPSEVLKTVLIFIINSNVLSNKELLSLIFENNSEIENNFIQTVSFLQNNFLK